MADVEAIRRRCDPLVGVIPAHVTLVFPFAAEMSDESLRRHVETATGDVHPFEIELAGFSCVEDRYLVLGVGKGVDEIRGVHRRLYSGPLAPYLEDVPYTPHVTVGRFGASDACAMALKGLQSTNLRVTTSAHGAPVYDLETSPYPAKFEVRWR